MQPNGRTWFLIARSFSREASKEELEELFQLLRTDARLSQQYEILNRLWNSSGEPEDKKSSEDDRRHIARILQLSKSGKVTGDSDSEGYFSKIKRRRRITRILAVATFLLLLVGITLWFQSSRLLSGRHIPERVIATPNGNRTKTILPDGTHVWLNSGSSISYDPEFNGDLREVSLQGEAYFDVVKNPKRPFIVHTGGIDIRVLGTAFNVKSYPDDKTVETTLIRGLVQVTRENASGAKPIILHPNQKLVVEKTAILPQGPTTSGAGPQGPAVSLPYHITLLDSSVRADAKVETAWLYNRLAFRGDNFTELAEKLERWYNVRIFFEDEKVKQLSFNGSFTTETVQQAFAALQSAAAFNFKINGNEIFISSSK